MPRAVAIAMLVLFGAALTAAASAQPRVLEVACAEQHGVAGSGT